MAIALLPETSPIISSLISVDMAPRDVPGSVAFNKYIKAMQEIEQTPNQMDKKSANKYLSTVEPVS
jgi:hypothetical protein